MQLISNNKPLSVDTVASFHKSLTPADLSVCSLLRGEGPGMCTSRGAAMMKNVINATENSAELSGANCGDTVVGQRCLVLL